MNGTYDELARAYADQQRQAYTDTFNTTLNDLLDMANAQKSQQEIQYNNLVNQINANAATLKDTYNQNARQAYVNKLLQDQQTTNTLSRMNLNNSGFRLTQDTLNANQYSANLNQLANIYAQGEQNIGNQLADALADYNANLAGIDADTAAKELELRLEMQDKGNDIYQTAYNNYYDDLVYQDKLKQQAWENEMAARKYEDALKQQAFENQLAQKELALKAQQAASSGSSNPFGSGSSSSSANGNELLNGDSTDSKIKLTDEEINASKYVTVPLEDGTNQVLTVGSVFGNDAFQELASSSRIKSFTKDNNKYYIAKGTDNLWYDITDFYNSAIKDFTPAKPIAQINQIVNASKAGVRVGNAAYNLLTSLSPIGALTAAIANRSK